MDVRALPPGTWSTSSSLVHDRTIASDLSLLGDHYLSCNGCKGRLFSIRCAIDALDAFVASRFVTTMVVVAVTVGVCSLVL